MFLTFMFSFLIKKQKKTKKKRVNAEDTAVNETAVVNLKLKKSQAQLNGHSLDAIPAQSSKDFSSDSEKEMVRVFLLMRRPSLIMKHLIMKYHYKSVVFIAS